MKLMQKDSETVSAASVESAAQTLKSLDVWRKFPHSTSYSQIAHGTQEQETDEGRLQKDEVDSTKAKTENAVSTAEDKYPRGAELGNAIHKIFELVDFEEVGKHKYSFLNLCLENPEIELGDETEKIFLCANGTVDDVSEKMQAFLNYIASGTPSDTFTNELENEVKKARDHIKWRTEYMTFLEQLEREREEGRREGLEVGREEGREEERVNTLREKARADAAENRADKLAEEILELKKQLESLMRK